MNAWKTLSWVVAGVIAAVMITVLTGRLTSDPGDDFPAIGNGTGGGSGGDAEPLRSLLQRLTALEARVEALVERIDELSSRTEADLQAQAPPTTHSPSPEEVQYIEVLTARLIAHGFAPGRAEWIAQRHSALVRNALQVAMNHDVNREPLTVRQRMAMNPTAMLREELGDRDFERFMRAIDRPTDIGVMSVRQHSESAYAGLQAGDRIVAYAGQRVLNLSELAMASAQGVAGEPVAVDILRDGQPMQIILPRGPLEGIGVRPQLPDQQTSIPIR